MDIAIVAQYLQKQGYNDTLSHINYESANGERSSSQFKELLSCSKVKKLRARSKKNRLGDEEEPAVLALFVDHLLSKTK